MRINDSQFVERQGVVSPELETLLNEYEVARLTGLSVASIRRRRLLRQPPQFLKLGASVRYRPSAIRDWLESQEVLTTALGQ
jgi:predicted DNA-binding transcriptional regulator AlpA